MMRFKKLLKISHTFCKRRTWLPPFNAKHNSLSLMCAKRRSFSVSIKEDYDADFWEKELDVPLSGAKSEKKERSYFEAHKIEQRLSNSVRRGEWGSAIKFGNLLEKNKVALSDDILNKLLGSSVQLKDLVYTQNYFARFLDRKIAPSNSTILSTFKFFRESCAENEHLTKLSLLMLQIITKNTLNNGERVQTGTDEYNFLLICHKSVLSICLKSNKILEASNLLSTMKKLFEKPLEEEEDHLLLMEIEYRKHLDLNSVSSSFLSDSQDIDHLQKRLDQLVTISSELGKVDDSYLFLQKMIQSKMSASMKTLLNLISSSLSSNRIEIVSFCLNQLSEHYSCTNGDISTLVDLVERLGKEARSREIVNLFKAITANPKLFDERSIPVFNSAIKQLFNAKKFSEVDQIVTFLRNGGKKLDPSTCSALLFGYFFKQNDFPLFESFLESIKIEGVKFDDKIYECIVKVYKDNRNFKQAILYGKQAIESHQPLSSSFLSNLIFCSCQISDLLSALQYYDQIIESSFSPTLEAFQGLVPLLCKRNDFVSAYELYRTMLSKYNYLPSPSISNAIIQYCPFNRMNSFFKMSIKYDHLTHNSFTYTILIQRSAAERRFDLCLEYFRQMQETKCTIDLVVYKVMFTSAMLCKEYQYLSKFMDSALSKFSIGPQNVFYKEIMWVDIFLENERRVQAACKGMWADKKAKTLRHNFLVLVDILSNSGAPKTAINFFSKYLGHNIQASTNEFVAPILSSIAKNPNKQHLKDLLSLVSPPKEPDCLALLVKVYCSCGEIDSAIKHFQNLVNDFHLDVITCPSKHREAPLQVALKAIILYYISNENFKSVQACAQRAIDYNILDISIANELLSFYLKMNNQEQFEKLFASLHTLNLRPDDNSFALLFSHVKPSDYEGVSSATQMVVSRGLSLGTHLEHPLSVALRLHVRNETTYNLILETIDLLADKHPFHAKDFRLLVTNVKSTLKKDSIDIDSI